MKQVRLLFIVLALLASAAFADEIEDLKRKNEELEKRIEKLEGAKQPEEPDEHHEEHGRDLFHHDFGEVEARVNIHMVGLFAVGYSSIKDRFTERLQGGGHDPKRRGFNLQQLELAFSGELEPYLSLDAFAAFSLEGVELEEAYFRTLGRPAGLQLEGGLMLTEFGIINPQHPHEWHWLDQPVINTRLLGGEGTRGVGLRLGWLTPLPWFSEVHVGVQMANDETMVSFLGGDDSQSPGGFAHVEREVEGFKDFLYLLRWHNRVVASAVSIDIGLSGLAGPNASGDRGATWILGGDFALQWKNDSGARLMVQSEVMYRYFQANGGAVDGAQVDPAVLGDWGGYLYVLGSPVRNWSFGLRGEFADAREEGAQARVADSLRDRRLRLSPLVEWQCCDLARVRLQYNFDHVQHLKESTAHGVWLSIEIEFGTHHHDK